MKKMCILPSQIPLSYRNTSPTFNTSRRQEASAAHQNRFDLEDVEEQGFVVEQNETEQLISEEFPIDLVVHGNSHHVHNINGNEYSQCQPGTYCCSSSSSEHYIGANNIGPRFPDGLDEAETSLIPAVIRQNRLHHNRDETSFLDIHNQHSNYNSTSITTTTTTTTSTTTIPNTPSTVSTPVAATTTSTVPVTTPSSQSQPNCYQVEVTVCVNQQQPSDS
ncbi:hypothetical protein Ahia01_000039600 [Argonauta hians]